MKRALLPLALVLVAAALPGGGTSTAASTPCGDPAQRPWCNTALPPDQRAGLLLAALTQDEKLSLLAGVDSSEHTGQTPAIDRVGLRSVALTDGPKGVKQGLATALPIPMAVAASFDPKMASLAGMVIGNEAKAKANDVILAPTVNIMRTPLGGRTFEAFGEDPYLVSRTAVNWIEAAQAQGVIGEVKHYCCNNQEGQLGLVGEKDYSSSDLDERTLREIYLPAFEAAVKQLRGFTKVSLAPGKSKTVSFPLDNRAFSYWDAGTGSWQVAPGCYGVFLGSSSRDLPLHGVIARGNAVC